MSSSERASASERATAGRAVRRWRCRAADPTGVAAWLGDPDAAAHSGESLTSVPARAGGRLDEQERAGLHGRLVAVTHPILARAVAVHALRAPASVFRHLDAGPPARVDLTHNGVRWALRGFGPPGP
ncbi:histidine phosphatase family protein [Embleya sp. NPDC001921]